MIWGVIVVAIYLERGMLLFLIIWILKGLIRVKIIGIVKPAVRHGKRRPSGRRGIRYLQPYVDAIGGG